MSNYPSARYLGYAGAERVDANDAVILTVRPGGHGRLVTEGLKGCSAVGGFVLAESGEAVLGLSHRPVGVDVLGYQDAPYCLSSQFMYLLSRYSYRLGDLRAAKIMVATMLMEPEKEYQLPVVRDTSAVAADLRSFGRVRVDTPTYRRLDTDRLGHNVAVVMTPESVSIDMPSVVDGQGAVYHDELILNSLDKIGDLR